MSKILYLECASGISGDMTVGALLDLGADQAVLDQVLRSIPIQGFATQISRVRKSGLDVCDFDVILDAAHANHDHDMEYLYGHEHTYGHEDHGHNNEHTHSHEDHEHHHEHTHSHEEHEHNHQHRGLPEILTIIQQTSMTENAQRIAARIFQILARAESKAHGVPEQEVHFHEVGAVDSIVDIISVAVCLDNLSIDQCIVPTICEGQGTVRCQHGILPVPVPAVVNIVADNQLRLSITSTQGELVTPTGAAIVAAVKTGEQLPESFVVEKVGMGAGKRAYDRPSFLRAMLIHQ